jgi:hypothetical protein
MKYFKRFVYLGYYLKTQDWNKYLSFCNYVSKQNNTFVILEIFRTMIDTIRYNISPLEYFLFQFKNKTHEDKTKWAGTGTMYEYQLAMNPKSKREILDDKRKFFKAYRSFVLHKTASIEELEKNSSLIADIINSTSRKIVFKVSNGKCGAQVSIIETSEISKDTILNYMKHHQFDLVEEFIVQHASMSRLSPSGVNTVRIFTQLDKNNEVVILGCRQRISVNSPVDNLAAGNIVAAIDDETGIINTKAFYSDITKKPVEFHPVTSVKICGFQVPYWSETLQLVKDAALLHKQNRSIGWDIVITEKGPGLIEGNHDWCKLVWQLPVQQGLKHMLDKHLSEFKQLKVNA